MAFNWNQIFAPDFDQSKCSGDLIISYMEVSTIFCTRMDFTKLFEMSLDFMEIQNIENMSMGLTYRVH